MSGLQVLESAGSCSNVSRLQVPPVPGGAAAEGRLPGQSRGQVLRPPHIHRAPRTRRVCPEECRQVMRISLQFIFPFR